MNRGTVQVGADIQKRKQINYDLLSLHEEREKLESSHLRDDFRHQQGVATLLAVQANQDLKLQKLESNIKKCEKNLLAQLPHLTELEAQASKQRKKLAKIQEDTQKMISASEKRIQVLKEMKSEAEEELRIMREEENRHRLMLLSKNKEMEEALNKMKKKEREKFEDAETLYKSRELALMDKIKCINLDIELVAKELDTKEKELKELKKCHMELQTKYHHKKKQ